jgi:hypothetical protein
MNQHYFTPIYIGVPPMYIERGRQKPVLNLQRNTLSAAQYWSRQVDLQFHKLALFKWLVTLFR